MVENIGSSMIDMINMSCGCYKLHHACKRITLITKQTCVYRPCKTYHLSLKRGFSPKPRSVSSIFCGDFTNGYSSKK